MFTDHNVWQAAKGVCENEHFFDTHLTFCPDFYYFHGDFWHSNNVDVYSFFVEGVSESVWFVHMKMFTFMDGHLMGVTKSVGNGKPRTCG